MTDENNAPKENTGANVEKVETIKLTQEEIITEKMKQRV